MSIQIADTIREYLKDLETTVDQVRDTWRPDDPQYRADLYRQTMINLSYAYFAYFHADAEHPDWRHFGTRSTPTSRTRTISTCSRRSGAT